MSQDAEADVEAVFMVTTILRWWHP